MKIKKLSRRDFILQTCGSLSASLLLKACTRDPTSAKNLTNSDLGEPSLSLEFISVPPANSQPPTKLLVCLHGFGANAQDLASFAPLLNLPDYQFMFLEAPFSYPNQPGGRMWYDLNSLNSKDFQGLTSSRQRLRDWLKSSESRTGVPLSRTILSGFSQGGAMTLDVGLTLPLAGLVSLSGYLHSEPQPAAGKSFPAVLIVHGKQDQVVPLAAAVNARDVIKALGVEKLKYQEFDMGHEIQPAVLDLMRNFILDTIN